MYTLLQTKTRIFITLLISTGAIFFTGSTYAWWSDAADTTIPLCQGNECTLQAGVDALKTPLENSGINTTQSLTDYVITIVQYFLGFVTVVAVLYIIYAGFQVMTGGGDEEKSKKAKNIIIYVTIGIAIMWLAYAIVDIIMVGVDPEHNRTTWLGEKTKSIWSISSVDAYTENDLNTFADYQKQLQANVEMMETEFRLNGQVSSSLISQARSLVDQAYLRLPDNPDASSKNDSAKRAVDLAIGLMEKNPGSQAQVQTGIQGIVKFMSSTDIKKMSGSISASPNSGNVPLTTSFLAEGVVDPSGVNPVSSNYIWWTREDGGRRRELGRGTSLTYTFSQEGTYQIFLDVISGSRNKKGYIDVLPLSVSEQITVKPRLGNIVMLVNGVNVSNMSMIKINPNIGKMGIVFDATASRAISNGTITKTKWDFGNGNVMEFNGSPVVERQIFANEGEYKVTLEMQTNEGASFKKDIQIIVRDPAAVIQSDRDIGHIGEDFSMSALSYFTNNPNVVYSWKVIPVNGDGSKPLTTKEGTAFSHKFTKVGDYIVTLTSRSPNGNTDQDSKTITIESREPTVNLETPVSLSREKPNTFVFDASRSFDSDTNTLKDLSYTWSIDGSTVELNNQEKGGAVGTYTFPEKGNHTISVTVANVYGKVSHADRAFSVTSTLTVKLNIVPRAAPIGTNISMQAIAPNAAFFEWNVGDGTVGINGTADHIEHIYKKTGIYTVTLIAKNSDGSETNSTEQKVYVTDTNSPFALIDIKNGSDTMTEDPNACGGGAFVVNRSDATQIDGSQSINVDGTSSDMTYTWSYLDRVKTGPTLSEKFSELGCFPITLSVRSNKNGVTNTSKKMMQIKNLPPKITSITQSIDASKKDSQKILVNVSANGAVDTDGVITSYIWYYKTESDSEPQSVSITQSPKMTFVLPNVTEKYTFGVIIEDNDGAKINSSEYLKDQSPLIISNDNGNVNLPLITLTTRKTTVLAGESLDFVVSAKNILGTDITSKSDYQWDFDGDGRIDKKTTEPRASFVYKNSGNYTMKVKVVSNGVSNSKYQTIVVKNELKARIKGYMSGERVLLMNASAGSYNQAIWRAGEIESTSLTSIVVPASTFASGGTASLNISASETENATTEITLADIESLTSTSGSGIVYQSFPLASTDTITLQSSGDPLMISAFGNGDADKFVLDSDTKIDSDLDGIADNDADNKNTASYTDGSVFSISDISSARSRTRQMKLSVYKNGTLLGSKDIAVVLAYIPEAQNTTPSDISGTGSDSFTTQDKANLEQFQAKVRTLESDDRIILTQAYNKLIEGWDDFHDRTQNLLDIQSLVDGSKTISEGDKTALSGFIDTILVGDSQGVNEVSVASQVISGIIPAKNPNRATILEKLELIKGHPGELATNKALGKEILELIKNDTDISVTDKNLIKSQLSVIVNGGGSNIPASEVVVAPTTTGSGFFGGILKFIGGAVKVFAIILGVLLLILLIGYIFYRVSRKNNDMGFQDFLIDSVFHSKGAPKKTAPTTPIVTPTAPANLVVNTPVQVVAPSVDPLVAVTPITPPYKAPQEVAPVSIPAVVQDTSDPHSVGHHPAVDPLETQEASIPDWLKAPVSTPDPLSTPTPIEATQTPVKIEVPAATGETELPSWLTGHTDTPAPIVTTDPLATPIETPTISEDILAPTETMSETNIEPSVVSEPPSDDLPDWLKPAPTSEAEVTLPRSTKVNTSEEIEGVENQEAPQTVEIPEIVLEEDGISNKKPPTSEVSSRKKDSPPAKGTQKKTAPKKRTIIKQEKEKSETPSVPQKSSTTSDDLPDWLK